MSSSIPTSTVLMQLFEYQNNLKLFHFQTRRYGYHKAADQLYARLIDLVDQFFEVYQGKYKRLPSLHGTLRLRSISDKEFAAYTRAFMVQLERAARSGCKVRTNSDLCNILDEIRAALAQFIYLLTFK